MLSSNLKLRLYQRNKISALAQYITDSGIEQRLRDKRHIHNNDINSTDITARKPACVAALHNTDPRVCTQLRSELISAGIHRVNTRGTALEQHLGKASGRRAYVGCDSATSVDFECIKRAEQLVCTSSDIVQSLAVYLYRSVVSDILGRAVCRSAVDRYSSLGYQRSRAAAARRKTARKYQLVKAHLYTLRDSSISASAESVPSRSSCAIISFAFAVRRAA